MNFWRSPYRFLVAAAVLAALFCLFPIRVDAPDAPQTEIMQAQTESQEILPGLPAGADLSERTQAGCALHRTLFYAPCGHSVQRRESLPAVLVGLSRQALESEIGEVIPGATVTGFSAAEVDISVKTDIPCPLHWVLRAGEDGVLAVLQNVTGETLSIVRGTEVPLARVPEEEQQDLVDGRVFDDVQALEGYLESLTS